MWRDWFIATANEGGNDDHESETTAGIFPRAAAAQESRWNLRALQKSRSSRTHDVPETFALLEQGEPKEEATMSTHYSYSGYRQPTMDELRTSSREIDAAISAAITECRDDPDLGRMVDRAAFRLNALGLGASTVEQILIREALTKLIEDALNSAAEAPEKVAIGSLQTNTTE
jgi:hypothetical protein